MTRFELSDMHVSIDGDDLTYVVSVDLEDGKNEVVFEGEAVKSALAGQNVTKITITYEHDGTAVTGNNAILAAVFGDNDTPAAVLFHPLGNTAGLPEFTFDGILLKYGPTGTQARSGRLQGEAYFPMHKEWSNAPGWDVVPA